MTKKNNLILIGMPGVGKSTIGILLAKSLGRNFLDTDVLIQAACDKTLSQLIQEAGMDGFRRIEEQYVECLDIDGFVIATGGSVVYYDAAMQHLKSMGTVIYLYLPLAVLQQRLSDITARGVVIEPGQTLETLFEKRRPLYEKYGEVRIDLTGLSHEQAVEAVIRQSRDRIILDPE